MRTTNKEPSTSEVVAMEIEESKPASASRMVVGGLSPLSESIWKETTNTKTVGDVSAKLAWKDLTVMVTLSNGETQNVLEGLTGYAEPGTFTALMGPSGSGKSTLLDALSSRLATNAFLSGNVYVNGRKTKLSFGTAAYVTQDDNLIGTLTVRETISYSARLRLPDKMGWGEKRALVESTIIEMGLQDCADTVIGNWHLRGISGGEKRRVSIALEILMRPRLLFLDEPTSGLDRTVIASIHQPSSEVFELFDRLYLLSGGKTVYFGLASEAYEFFAQAGFPCPALRNPSDHFLRCINSDFDKVKATLKGSMKLRFEASDDPLEKGIFMLVSGYFRLPNDIPKPVWRYPMSYISFHFWALQGQYQNDLRGLMFDNQTPDLPQIPGEYVLEYVFQITVTRSKWINLSVIFSMIIIYRIIFFLMIKINEDLTPWVRGYLARKRMKQKNGGQNTTVAPYGLTQSPSLRTYVADNSK
ncbi:hypothetical protein M8C21_002705, partial [Ambrosia artemisiifolia]